MNIFYLDHNTIKCSEYHVDKHVVKMILEYCQLLSTAHRLLDGKEIIVKSKTGRNVKRWVLDDSNLESQIYAATHINHPSAVWARQSLKNYTWLSSLLNNLCTEYTYRYGKVHKCQQTGLVSLLLSNTPKNIPNIEFTEPTPAMPDFCKVKNNSIQSYRNYYVRCKEHLWSWKGKINSRKEPIWFEEKILSQIPY